MIHFRGGETKAERKYQTAIISIEEGKYFCVKIIMTRQQNAWPTQCGGVFYDRKLFTLNL